MSTEHATTPTDEINRIIIGLGGQGSRIVNEVRKAVLAEGALPAGLDFIAVDSDRLALASLDSIPEEQRLHVSAPDDNVVESIVPWLPHEFRPKAGGGCGMQRLTGKAMYLVHKHRILEAVREVARRLRQRTQIANFMVVIVNAFGGGTGSGMAIDFSIDVRAELKEITGQDPLLFGIGVLPARSETIQRANGVAAIKELHFLLSRKEPIVVAGRDFSNPFELYFLLGREVMGIEKDDDLMQGIVRFTIDLGLIPTTRHDRDATGKGAGWVDLQDIRTLVKGASHLFSTFGYYRAVFPAREAMEYLDTLDAIEALRKEMPALTTELDARRREMEDQTIRLKQIDARLERARTCIATLRANGILGANRPELAALLEVVVRIETDSRNARDEAGDFERKLPETVRRREETQARMKELTLKAESLRANLVEPVQTRTTYRVPLTEHELERLRQERHLLVEGDFRSVMAALGRLAEFNDKTLDVVGKSKILHLPLLNYRMAYQTSSALPREIVASLKKHGFVRYDAVGNPVVSNEQLWMMMAMLSTQPSNVDPSRVSARPFKESVEGNVARRAEVKIVPSRARRFEVVIHSWMVGLQIAPVAPGYPPRLRELEWLTPEYEQTAREGSLVQHHAFLYGDPLAFGTLTGLSVERADSARTNQLVTEFWTSYAPMDAPSRWSQLPPLLAESLLAANGLAQATTDLAEALDELAPDEAASARLERLTRTVAEQGARIEEFSRRVAEDEHALKARLLATAQQLERTPGAPRDAEHLVAMQELAAEAVGAVDAAGNAVAQLRQMLPEALGHAMATLRDQHASGPRASTRAGARVLHALAQVEGNATLLDGQCEDAATHLRSLETALARIQEMLNAKSRIPFRATMRTLAKAAVAGAEPRERSRSSELNLPSSVSEVNE